MFRITERRGRRGAVLKLEGRFSADVVGELDASWRSALNSSETVWVDLTDVDVVDVAAREQLTRMHRAAVRFVAGGCFTRELVREISECR